MPQRDPLVQLNRLINRSAGDSGDDMQPDGSQSTSARRLSRTSSRRCPTSPAPPRSSCTSPTTKSQLRAILPSGCCAMRHRRRTTQRSRADCHCQARWQRRPRRAAGRQLHVDIALMQAARLATAPTGESGRKTRRSTARVAWRIARGCGVIENYGATTSDFRVRRETSLNLSNEVIR